MDDLISRQAAIDAFYIQSDDDGWWTGTCEDFEIFINGLPSAQEWIPVSERLPEKDGMYLVSISPSSRLEKRVDTDFYSHFGVWQIFGKFVTAWIPLPEPYREETEDETSD